MTPNLRLCVSLVLSALLAAMLAVAASGQEPPAGDAAQTQNVAAADDVRTAEGAADGDAAPGAAGDADTTWQDDINDWFGENLVDPIGSVLMYGFGTADIKWIGVNLPFIVMWLLAGAIFFTLRMVFINIRGFWHAIRLTKGDYDKPGDEGEVSHFQALASALSATVGLGNIAGVAIAVGMGGPGAIFWMVIAGLLGMTSKFTECSLAQMYRKVAPDGTVSGGPMHYLRDGLARLSLFGISLAPLGFILSVMFAILCVGASVGGGCAFQVNQSGGALRYILERDTLQELDSLDQQIAANASAEADVEALRTERAELEDNRAQREFHFRWIYGLVMATFVGLVIIGGFRRIAATASRIVPLMCALYVAMALWVLLANWTQIDDALLTIFNGAFRPEGFAGGALGVMVIGIQRAAFSNEAGVGSAAIAHAAAKTDEPISEGFVALLEPFIDTVVICTMTGLVIVITGAYSDPANEAIIQANRGAVLTSNALESVQNWFPLVLGLAVVMFAFSTMISWSYYGERCVTHLLGPRASLPFKLFFLVCVFLGSIMTATNVLEFSDLMLLSMALPNILGLVLLSGQVRRALTDYWRRYRLGEFEVNA